MNDVQTNQLGRGSKVEQFLNTHAADLTSTPEISSILLPELQARIQKAYADDALATQDNSGNAFSKSDTRISLEENVYHVAMGLVSYADDTDDFVMQNMFDFNFSQIQGFRDSRLQQYAKSVYAKAIDATIAAALAADHNITAADLSELNGDIKDFDAIIATPLEKKAESTAYGKLVDRDISAVNDTLEKIRRKMRTYRKNNRLLFDMFTAVDSIDDYGHGGSKSTQSGSINSGETKQVAVIDTFSAAAPITLKNNGTVALIFIVFLAGTPQGTGTTVPAGSTVSTTLGALAGNGDALYVTNNSAIVGSWSITL